GLFECVHLLCGKGANDTRRITSRDTPRGNITCYDRSGADNSAFTYSHAFKYNDASAKPRSLAYPDRSGFDDAPVMDASFPVGQIILSYRITKTVIIAVGQDALVGKQYIVL